MRSFSGRFASFLFVLRIVVILGGTAGGDENSKINHEKKEKEFIHGEDSNSLHNPSL
jgi:hypothetical protein